MEVCLNHPVKDSYSGADFPAGHQTSTGSQALSFVRQRHGLDNGDLDRTHRQQAFIASAAHKLRSAGTFTDLGKLQDLIDTAKKDVVISSGWDMLSFAQQAQGLTGGNLEFTTLPIAGYQKVNGQDVNTVDTEQVRAAVRAAFGITAPAPPVTPNVHASATIDVRNTTGKTGLAATVAQALTPYGFRSGELSSLPAAASSIAYGAGAKDDAAAAASLAGRVAGHRGQPGVEGTYPDHPRDRVHAVSDARSARRGRPTWHRHPCQPDCGGRAEHRPGAAGVGAAGRHRRRQRHPLRQLT